MVRYSSRINTMACVDIYELLKRNLIFKPFNQEMVSNLSSLHKSRADCNIFLLNCMEMCVLKCATLVK